MKDFYTKEEMQVFTADQFLEFAELIKSGGHTFTIHTNTSSQDYDVILLMLESLGFSKTRLGNNMTMTYEQFLLTKLAEEASEVAQMAAKCCQFGLDEVYSEVGVDNRTRLNSEFNGLLVIVWELNKSCNLDFKPCAEHRESKLKKLKRYLTYSIGLGKVEQLDITKVFK